MDEQRFQELEKKRDEFGLSKDEANELGRLMAEKEGKPYSNAEERAHPDSLPVPVSVKAAEEPAADPRGLPRDPETTPQTRDEEAKEIAR